jgi:hypothetical protein
MQKKLIRKKYFVKLVACTVGDKPDVCKAGCIYNTRRIDTKLFVACTGLGHDQQYHAEVSATKYLINEIPYTIFSILLKEVKVTSLILPLFK